MGGQLDGIFLAGSLPHEFIILIVTSFICLWLINLSLSLCRRPAGTNGVSRRSGSFGSVRVRAGLVGSGRARVVEFSQYS